MKEGDRCPVCKGQKVVEEKKVLEVHIEKGAKPGQKFVYEGEADQLPDTIPGDVVVVLAEKDEKDSPWKRAGDDLVYQKDLTLAEALTGFEFTLTHLDGRALVVRSAPKDVVKPNDVRVIDDEGMPKNQSGLDKGKLYLRFTVVFPTHDQIKAHADKLKKILPAPAERVDKKALELGEIVTAKPYDIEAEQRRKKKQRHSAQSEEEDEATHHGPQTCVHQ